MEPSAEPDCNCMVLSSSCPSDAFDEIWCSDRGQSQLQRTVLLHTIKVLYRHQQDTFKHVSTVTTRNTVELPLSSHLLIHQVHHDVHFRHIGLLSKTDLFCFITSSRDQPAQNFLRFSDFFLHGTIRS